MLWLANIKEPYVWFAGALVEMVVVAVPPVIAWVSLVPLIFAIGFLYMGLNAHKEERENENR